MSKAARDFEAMARLLDPDDLFGDDFGDVLHDATVKGMAASKPFFPRDTGALFRSLTDKNDPHHVFEFDGRTARLGTTLPQGAYQADRIPALWTSVLLDEISDYITDRLDDASS